jgi:hypothetical protein
VQFTANQIILFEYEVDHGPYRQAAFASLIDADYTDQADKILGEDFCRYLNQYFVGWKLTRAVELFPAKERPNRRGLPFKICTPPYKIVRWVLELATDADAETVRRHRRTTTYPFQLRYQRG